MQHFPRTNLTARLPSIQTLPAPLFLVGLLLVSVVMVTFLPVAASVVLLAAVAIALAVLIRPWIGIVALAIAIPWASAWPLSIGGAALDGSDLLLALTLAAWLAHGVVRHSIVVPRLPLLVPLVLFAAIQAVALLGAASYREGLPELLKWIQVLALYLVVVAALPAERAGWLVAGLLLAAISQAAFGLYQFATQSGPDEFVLMGRFLRAYGTFRQPNPFAGYLGLAAPLAASLAIWAWTASRASRRPQSRLIIDVAPRRWQQAALPLAALIICLGVLVSWSRGAWLGLAAALVVVLLAHARRAAPVLILAAVAVAAVVVVFGLADLLPPSITARIGDLGSYLGIVDVTRAEVTDASFSVVERLAHWQAAINMWTDHPWLGVGPGNYAVAYEAYRLPRWQDALGHAHNVYLNVAGESGLLGLLSYLVLWFASIWQALRGTASNKRFVAAVGAGVLGSLVHATIHNVFDNLWVQHIYLVLALMLGLVAVLDPDQMKDNEILTRSDCANASGSEP
ncbi:MAG: O-antigen ligase family protein [Anaerolineae bacterium]|nr:O-antigen ligase family protein [Anaerolineae bacterium]MCB0230125.1 O-antigen ligase family protein [Anaerolineae bacterium]MCB0249443.1 O-antigen ligase family protein [Anaerolineae bacterium]MCB9131824.1 O-antigen ligase family protein [Anaerolineales bacterium]